MTRLLTGACAIAAVVTLAGCSDESPPGADRLPARAVVFTADELGGDGEPDADWTPSVDDVLAAEDLLEARLDGERAGDRPDLEPFDDYYRQYAGVDGDTIRVNATCDSFDGDWDDHWFWVDDGGACYWEASVEDGEVTRLTVNGPA